MNRSTLTWSLLALLLLLVAFVVLGDWGSSPSSKNSEQHLEELAADSPLPDSEVLPQSAADGVDRKETKDLLLEEEEGGTSAAVESGYVTFVGRCVEEGSLRPIAEVEVELWVAYSNSRLREKYGEPEPEMPEGMRTGADGRFEIRGVLGASYQYGLDLRDQHHLQRSKRWFEEWTLEQIIDLGDVVMPKGVPVRGIVRDQDGFVVPGFTVSLAELPAGANGMGAGTVYGWTEDDGTFTLNSGVPVGTWEIRVRKKGYALDNPKELTVSKDDTSVYLDLRAKKMPSLRGMIQDAAGNPIAKAHLETVRTGSGMMETARTNVDGEFTIFARRDSLEAVSLQIRADGFAPLETAKIPWSSSGLIFALDGLPSVPFLVRERVSGRAVQNYHLLVGKAAAAEGDLSGFGMQTLGESLPDGSRVLTGPLPGTYSLYVIPREQALRVLGPHEFTVPAEENPVVLEVERMEEVAVEVLDSNGAPVVDATVRSLDLVPDLRFAKKGWYLDPRGRGSSRSLAANQIAIATVHSEDKTTAEGHAKVYAPPSQGVLVLQVESALPFYLEEFSWPRNSEAITIQLEPPALFRGQVRNAPAAPGQYGLLLGPGAMKLSDYGHSRVPPEKVLLPDENGYFEAEGIEEGSVQIQVVFPPSKVEQATGERSWWVHPDRLEPVSFEVAKEEIIEFDLLTFALGSLEASFQVDETLFSGEIGLLRLGAGFSRSHLMFTTDAHGRLILDSLPQGEYQAWLKIEGNWIATDGVASVSAGQRSSASYTASPHRVVLRFVDQAGKPLPAGTELEFNSGWYQVFQLGDDGKLVLESAPRTPIRFSISLPYHGSVIPFDTLEEGATYTVECKSRDSR